MQILVKSQSRTARSDFYNTPKHFYSTVGHEMDEANDMNRNSNSNIKSTPWNAITNKSSSSNKLFYDVIWPSLVVQGWKKVRNFL